MSQIIVMWLRDATNYKGEPGCQAPKMSVVGMRDVGWGKEKGK